VATGIERLLRMKIVMHAQAWQADPEDLPSRAEIRAVACTLLRFKAKSTTGVPRLAAHGFTQPGPGYVLLPIEYSGCTQKYRPELRFNW
jgi:hypothetical protein